MKMAIFSMLKNNSLSNTERFIKMNHFIKQIEIQENPDLIIMGIMNGAVSLGMDIIEDFGIDVYGVRVQSDLTVLWQMYFMVNIKRVC